MLTDAEPQWLTEEVKTGVSARQNSLFCCVCRVLRTSSCSNTHYLGNGYRQLSSPSSSTEVSCWDPTPESPRGESVRAQARAHASHARTEIYIF